MNFRGLEFIKVYWQTWIVALGPLLLSPILFLSTDTQQVDICLFLAPTRFVIKLHLIYRKRKLSDVVTLSF